MLRGNLSEPVAMVFSDDKVAQKERARKKKHEMNLSKAQIYELRGDFHAFESARNFPIEAEELEKAMKHLGVKPKTDKLSKMLENQDPYEDIEFNDFLHVVSLEMKKKNTKEELKRVFQMFADDGTAKISLHNLQRVSKELGQNVSTEELKEMIEGADQDGDNEISWEDFQHIMKEHKLH